ncbi:unnamed protein product [Phytophthora fragariaefolia]|uniref:Unnamed protein product n=1 Tax=Phytophthora fragariaefolia TaxID=1490495 RepID=A0A9W6YKX1_9STRA|nr:unnamed protein product [Phytophthora fragariaefolia]
MPRQGKPAYITTSDVENAIKRAATKAGQDPRRFSSHSLRSGGATYMYRSGADALWVSDALKVYTRLCKESVATLSADMVTGSGGIQRWTNGADAMTMKLGAPLSSSLTGLS